MNWRLFLHNKNFHNLSGYMLVSIVLPLIMIVYINIGKSVPRTQPCSVIIIVLLLATIFCSLHFIITNLKRMNNRQLNIKDRRNIHKICFKFISIFAIILVGTLNLYSIRRITLFSSIIVVIYSSFLFMALFLTTILLDSEFIHLGKNVKNNDKYSHNHLYHDDIYKFRNHNRKVLHLVRKLINKLKKKSFIVISLLAILIYIFVFGVSVAIVGESRHKLVLLITYIIYFVGVAFIGLYKSNHIKFNNDNLSNEYKKINNVDWMRIHSSMILGYFSLFGLILTGVFSASNGIEEYIIAIAFLVGIPFSIGALLKKTESDFIEYVISKKALGL